MEKYAVDKENDKFESKAQSMVKLGEAKSLSQARKMVAQGYNKPKNKEKDGK